jgi:hypothetical protein
MSEELQVLPRLTTETDTITHGRDESRKREVNFWRQAMLFP